MNSKFSLNSIDSICILRRWNSYVNAVFDFTGSNISDVSENTLAEIHTFNVIQSIQIFQYSSLRTWFLLHILCDCIMLSAKAKVTDLIYKHNTLVLILFYFLILRNEIWSLFFLALHVKHIQDSIVSIYYSAWVSHTVVSHFLEIFIFTAYRI